MDARPGQSQRKHWGIGVIGNVVLEANGGNKLSKDVLKRIREGKIF